MSARYSGEAPFTISSNQSVSGYFHGLACVRKPSSCSSEKEPGRTSFNMVAYSYELVILGKRVGCEKPALALNETTGLPSFPRFVVIKITPFAARAP